MRLAIKNIGNKIPSKKTGGTCITVIFKDLETNDEYKLYLDDTFQSTIKWIPHLKKGNVFDNCYTLTNPKFKNVIDSNSDFKIVREIKSTDSILEYNLEVTINGNRIFTHTFDTQDQLLSALKDVDIAIDKHREIHA